MSIFQELRRKRAELSVSLRKQARDEQLLKRRAMSPEAGEEPETEKVMTPSEIVQGKLHNNSLWVCVIDSFATPFLLAIYV